MRLGWHPSKEEPLLKKIWVKRSDSTASYSQVQAGCSEFSVKKPPLRGNSVRELLTELYPSDASYEMAKLHTRKAPLTTKRGFAVFNKYPAGRRKLQLKMCVRNCCEKCSTESNVWNWEHVGLAWGDLLVVVFNLWNFIPGIKSIYPPIILAI